jgi:hypothetical protein
MVTISGSRLVLTTSEPSQPCTPVSRNEASASQNTARSRRQYGRANSTVRNTNTPISAPSRRLTYSIQVLTGLKSVSMYWVGLAKMLPATWAKPMRCRVRASFWFLATRCAVYTSL